MQQLLLKYVIPREQSTIVRSFRDCDPNRAYWISAQPNTTELSSVTLAKNGWSPTGRHSVWMQRADWSDRITSPCIKVKCKIVEIPLQSYSFVTQVQKHQENMCEITLRQYYVNNIWEWQSEPNLSIMMNKYESFLTEEHAWREDFRNTDKDIKPWYLN